MGSVHTPIAAGNAPRGAAARASATLVHDLRGPLVTIDGFAGEIRHALEELDALLGPETPDAALVARLRTLLEEDLRPCLGFVDEAARLLHARIDALALPAEGSPRAGARPLAEGTASAVADGAPGAHGA